uniref:ELYS beta-propeller domain-containing protein n=1 Tax=Setaria digitata TaxID=48799 RepID=A0A915Q1J3_9BILA
MLHQQGAVKEVKLITEKTRSGTWGKFLTQQGEYTDWYCIIRKNCILIRQIHHKSPILYSCGFRSSCVIVDACSAPFRDGSSGVVVAVNDEQNEEYFLAYYSIKMSRIVKKISVHRKISRVVTVLDSTKRNEIECLHENLRNSLHLIAVGTYSGDCYLVHFGIDLPNITDPELRNPPFSSNLCKPYISHGRFNFIANNGAIYPVSVDEIHVTAITYLERCKTVVIGFSCGAFITINLHNGNDSSYYYSSSPVYSFSCQEPMDDPRPVLYLWVAYSEGKQKKAHVMLFVINFPNDEGQPPNQWTFEELIIIQYLVWRPENCAEWLSFRTIVSPPSREHTTRSISERQLSTEESFFRTVVTDTSRLLMTWKTPNNAVEGALFDLNAFYYKRLPRLVTFTESFLKLNPFVSVFTLPTVSDQEICYDYLINYSGVWQHQSPYSETNDFFIFAPSHSFEIITFDGNREFTIFVPSIQKIVLKWLDGNFEDAIGLKSDLACAYLSAVGLAKPSADISENSQASVVPLENESVVISSLLFNGEANDTLKKHIIICSNYNTIHQIASLIWKEVVNAKQKFDELSEPWFDRVPRALSAAGMCWLRNSAAVFHCAAELFAEISKRVPSEATTANYNMMASMNLVFYTNIVFLFHRGGLLPLKNYTALNARMKARLDERKKRLLPGSKLYIINLLEEMQSVCPNEFFWYGRTAEEWYPPNSIGTLLSVTLAMKITETSKYKLIGYFLLDYDDLMRKEPKVFDRFKWRFPYKDQAICNHIESNWRSDCGLEEALIKRGRVTITDAKAEEYVCEAERLMKRLLLDKKEIEFIKESLLKRPNGIREWNRFCLRRKMFARLLPANRCDRWTAKILEDFPVIQIDASFPQAGGEKMRNIPSKQCSAAHPFLSPCVRSYDRHEIFETPRRLHEVCKSSGLKEAPEASKCPMSPVYDRRISNYERILPKEDLENVHRLLQTPTPRHHYVFGITGEDSFSSVRTDHFAPVPIPTSILKTRKGRQDEADVTESQFKSLRFDLSNSNISCYESQVKEQKYGSNLREINLGNTLDVLNPEFLTLAEMKNEIFSERNLELETELENLMSREEKSGSTEAFNQESQHVIMIEEQSDSDITEDQERRADVPEKVLQYSFEEQEELENLPTIVESSDVKNENSTAFSFAAPVPISDEEQEDPEIFLNVGSKDNSHVVCNEKGTDQKIQDAKDMADEIPVTNSKLPRHDSTSDVNVLSRALRQRSNSLIDEALIELEHVNSDVQDSSQKEVSYEQEDETDPTSTEIEKALVAYSKMKGLSKCKRLHKGEDRRPYSEIRKSPRRHCVNGASSIKNDEITSERSATDAEVGSSKLQRGHRFKHEDPDNDRERVRTYSTDSFQSSPGIYSEMSTLSHRMLTRSAARAAKLASLSPEIKVTSRRRLDSEASSPHSRETTPRHSTRVIVSGGSSSNKNISTRKRRPRSGTGSPHSRESTPKRAVRTSHKNSPKNDRKRKKRLASESSSVHSWETAPSRSTQSISSVKTFPTGKSPRRRRAHSEQTEADSVIVAVTPKTSPIRRRRAASEDFQSKSESGSPYKQRTSSIFEPKLAKIDGLSHT